MAPFLRLPTRAYARRGGRCDLIDEHSSIDEPMGEMTAEARCILNGLDPL